MSDDIPCLACGKPIPEGAPSYPDVSGRLCAECAPSYSRLLDDDEPFVDMDSGEPISMEERRAIYDAHIAAGGKPTDGMAKP